MSKLDEKVEEYYTKMTGKMGLKVDKDLLRAVSKGLGPSIYNVDASKVSASDQAEMDRLKASVAKKFDIPADEKLDKAIEKAMGKFESSDRSKYRAIVYYILAKDLGKEGIYQ